MVGALALPMLFSVTPLASLIGATNAVQAAGTTSAFTALPSPVRLADTRTTGALGANTTVTVQVTAGQSTPTLPAAGTLVAAVLNVTVVGPAQAGYWTVFPTGGAVPTASNINVDLASVFAGESLTLPNMVTVPVPADGRVSVYSLGGGNVVVDMLGYYTPAATATAGRFVPLAAPSRMLDTRTSNTPMTPGETRAFAAPGAAGASAVALNMTAIGTSPGYWQVFPIGTTPGASSNLNSMAAGQVSANQVIVPVDANGQFNVFSLNGGQLIIDVVGTFTGAAAPSATDGLFVPLDTPTRFLDTRTAMNPLGAGKRLLPTWDVEVGVAANPAIARTDVSAVLLNVTVADTFAAGYVSATPAGSNDPKVKSRTTSNLNIARPGQTLANHAIVPVSSRGFDIFSQSPTHVIADVSGFYLGAPVAAPFGVPDNADPTPVFCATFTSEYINPANLGASGANISVMQQRLLDLGYWLQAVDGKYGWSTQQAVMAYQKFNNIAGKSGNVDATTAAKLSYPNCRVSAGTTSGDLFEVDKGRQMAFIIRGGKLVWALNVSTGGGYFYEDESNGQKFIDQAITDNGNFNVYRVSDTPRYEGTLGTMYRPRFVVRGIAVHGAPNVPNYPASHGCIRVSNPAMDMIWAQNFLPMGSRVWIHD